MENTRYKMSQPGIDIEEGLLTIRTEEYGSRYNVFLTMNYSSRVNITYKNDDIKKNSDEIYSKLNNNNFEILYDNRKVSAGFKFNDADLIGSPIRVIISDKSLKSGGAEVIINKDEPKIISINNLINELTKIKDKLFYELNK